MRDERSEMRNGDGYSYGAWLSLGGMALVLLGCGASAVQPHSPSLAMPATALRVAQTQVRALREAPELRFENRAISADGAFVAWGEPLESGPESAVYALLVSPTGGTPARKIAEVVNLAGLAWSPDGTKLAYSEGTIVRVIDRDGRSSMVAYTGPGGPYPGACYDLQWDGATGLSFVEIENARDADLAYPKRIAIRFATRP